MCSSAIKSIHPAYSSVTIAFCSRLACFHSTVPVSVAAVNKLYNAVCRPLVLSQAIFVFVFDGLCSFGVGVLIVMRNLFAILFWNKSSLNATIYAIVCR